MGGTLAWDTVRVGGLGSGKTSVGARQFASNGERSVSSAAVSVLRNARPARSMAQRTAADEFLLLTLDAAAGSVSWSRIATRLADLAGGWAIALCVYDARSRQVSMLAATDSHDAQKIARLVEAAEREIDGTKRQTSRTSSLAEEWRALADEGREYIAGRLMSAFEARYLCIVCGAPEASTPVPLELRKRLDAVLPHLARAAEINRRLSEAAAHSGASAAILDRLPFGLVQLDASGAVLHANGVAYQICQRRNGLGIKASGVHANSEGDETRLQKAISDAIASRDSSFSHRLSIRRNYGARPLSVLVTTVDSNGLTDCRPACLLFVTDPDMYAAPSPNAVADALGLTAAESRVVSALAMGVSLPDAASQLGISINTARTLLARAMAKTGTNSQIALVRTILTTIGLAQGKA